MVVRLGFVVVVVGLYIWFRVRGFICLDKLGIDSIFFYGFVFIGLVLGELFKRMVFDFNSIVLYIEFFKDYQFGIKFNLGSFLFIEGLLWMIFF